MCGGWGGGEGHDCLFLGTVRQQEAACAREGTSLELGWCVRSHWHGLQMGRGRARHSLYVRQPPKWRGWEEGPLKAISLPGTIQLRSPFSTCSGGSGVVGCVRCAFVSVSVVAMFVLGVWLWW